MESNTRALKARNLRYKKSIASGFNLDDILNELYEISSECDEVRYFVENDENTLMDALDGNEEEAYEFKMMFCDLSSECEKLHYQLSESGVYECFDDFFCRVAGGCTTILGYDVVETDYFKLSSFESQLAQEESEKRIMRMTKSEILATAEQCFGVASAFLNIRYKYDYLKAAFDILKGKNASYLKIIKDIEQAYEAADAEGWYYADDNVKHFENMISGLPDKVWVE